LRSAHHLSVISQGRRLSQKKREILQTVDRGEWADERPDVRAEDFLESWLDAIQPNIATTTHARYSGLVKRYFVPVIGDLMLRKSHRSMFAKSTASSSNST
jgi:hypothetical protein